MKSKKYISLVLSLFLLSAVLASCQNSETTTQTTEPADDVDIVVEMDASNYAFSETTITVKKGQTVRIELTVTQGVHDWVVDEFSAATNQAGAGSMVSVVFTADESGEFEYYCSVSGHRAMGMVGTLIVEE